MQEVFHTLKSPQKAPTVVLVSDGVEICGGDPCQAIRDKNAAGVDFIVHVVGFPVGEGDVSQLESNAQEGEGLFFQCAQCERARRWAYVGDGNTG